MYTSIFRVWLHLRLLFRTDLQAARMRGGRESASCAHTLAATSEGRDVHVRLKGRRPPSHLSPIPDRLIPAVVAGGRGRDRLEVSVSRCAHAVRRCQETAIREGLERKQLLGRGFGERGILGGRSWEIAYPLLPPICYDLMASEGRLQTLTYTVCV